MQILFVQPQPCIRTLKYAEGIGNVQPNISLFFAFAGKTLSELYGHGDEYFKAWFPLGDNPAAKLQEIVATHDIDLIHSHNAPDTLTNLCIDLFKEKIPIVHDIHDLMSIRKTVYEDGLGRAIDATNWFDQERKAIECSNAVIAVSDVILERVHWQGHRLPEISHVHPNYIPRRFIPKLIPKFEHKPANRPIRIVYEGFVSNNDGHYDLRVIFQALATEGMEVHIYPSRDNSSYQALADCEPNIIYHQSLCPEALFRVMTQYDFGWAGFNDTLNRMHLDTVLPNKLFEYIACGLPVIGFPHEALKNFLETHGLGLVINEIEGLQERLRTPEMEGVRKNVRRRNSDFTVEAKIGLIVNIYRKLCGNAAGMTADGYQANQGQRS